MSETVERVGRAISGVLLANGVRFVGKSGDECAEIGAKVAYAAVEAVREPTRAMVEAGALMVQRYDSRFESGSDTAEETWEAMIDAALAEGEKP